MVVAYCSCVACCNNAATQYTKFNFDLRVEADKYLLTMFLNTSVQ